VFCTVKIAGGKIHNVRAPDAAQFAPAEVVTRKGRPELLRGFP
jgi:hypothetical protein